MLDYYKRLDAQDRAPAAVRRTRTRRCSSSRTTAPSGWTAASASTSGCAARATSCCARSRPSPTRLTPDLIDWSRTVAWGEGGYYCRLFLNVEGREPQGVVAPDDYERVRSELKERARGARRRPGAADRDGRAPAGGPVRGGARDRARPPRLLRRPLLAERRPGRDRRRCTCSRTTPGPTTRTTRTRGCTCSWRTACRRGPGPSARCTTSRRRCSSCSASPCRPTWRGGACSAPRPRTGRESSASRDDSVTDTRTFSR